MVQQFFLLLLVSVLVGAQPSRSKGVEKPKYVEVFDDVESQLSIYPTDTEETASLVGQNVIFSDFCIKTRDLVMGDIKRTTANLATNVFSIFYNSFERLGVNKLTGVRDEDDAMDVDGDDLAMDEMLRKQQQPSGFFSTVIGVLASARDAVASSVVNTLNTIKSSVGIGSVSTALQDACAKVTEYEFDMRSRFDKTKAELGAAGLITVDTVEQLGCVTPDRVLRISGFCKMVKLAHQPLNTIMNYVS